VLALVASAFAARRVPIGQGARMALAWLLIFGAAVAGFSLRDDFTALGRRLVSGNAAVVAAPDGELRIRKNEDGHFYVDAKVNGKDVEFLVDSGATVTTVSDATARRVGLEAQGISPVIVETANGMTEAWRSRAGTLRVGEIERSNFPVHIAQAAGTDLLGMNFLSTLSTWRVEGEWLILKP
jgi:aspartyl protease family protein